MATRFYVGLPYSTVWVTPDASWENYSSFRYADLRKQGVPFQAYGFNGAVTAPWDGCVLQLLSDQLDDQTITGTVKSIFRATESNAAFDARAQMVIRVVTPTATVRGTLLAMDTGALSNEFATSLTNRKFPLNWSGSGTSLGSVVAVRGDRLAIEVGFRCHASGISSMTTLDLGSASTSDLAEDETSTDQFSPWVEFSQTLLWHPNLENGKVRRAWTDSRLNSSTRGENYSNAGVSPDDPPLIDLGETRKRPPGMTVHEQFGSSLPPAPPRVVTWYHKRAWRTETPGYVEWDTTDPSGVYSGGGTLYPTLGAVLWTWTTS